jgi:diguanylate cyclase (GGDEF)-like protein
MVADKTRWGLFFFSLAPIMLGSLFYCSLALPEAKFPVMYLTVVPIAGFVLFVGAFFFGHISYSRIHIVRVYFSGYAVGGIGMLYFLFCKQAIPLPAAAAPPAPGYAEICIGIALMNLCAVAMIPTATKYRITRSMTLGAIAVEAIVLMVLKFGDGAPFWVRPFFPDRMAAPLFWLIPLLFLVSTALSIRRIRREFYLGGIVAGCSLMLFSAWISRVLGGAHADQYQTLALFGCALYLSAGLVVHGFFRMEHRIAFDPLLKIYNRDYCSRIITEQANLDVSPPFGVAMIDIDHFKQVNDTYGHQAGDEVLHAVAQAVERGAGEDSITCRYGGEELAVFFPQRTAKEVAQVSERIRADIEKDKTKSGRKTIQVTVSIGVSHRDTFDQSIVEVIQAADKALYAAKNGGRNQVKIQKTPDAGARK